MRFSIQQGLLLIEGTPVRQIASTNHSGPFKQPPRFLVMHYTAGGSAEASANWLANPAAGASAHLIIARDGSVIQCVNLENRAWHAGRSSWHGLTGLNSHSIGIELANWGPVARSPDGRCIDATGATLSTLSARHRCGGPSRDWEIYPERQIETARAVACALREVHPIREVLGHDDIAPERKLDPGPAFDMTAFRKAVLGQRRKGTVTASSLNVRSGPGLSFPVVDRLPRGARVDLGHTQRQWISIGPEMWVFADYLT